MPCNKTTNTTEEEKQWFLSGALKNVVRRKIMVPVVITE